MNFSKYSVQADTYAPGLKPRSNPEDMEKIRALYSNVENRLKGIETDLENCLVEKFVLSFTKKGGIADEDAAAFESEDD